MCEFLNKYNEWLKSSFIDEETKRELESIKSDEKEIEDRFYKDLQFGTAGLRGVIGAGSNRMNKYTVGKATQGLANYIIKEGTQDKGVVIAYDCRHMSREFSEETASILNGNGIKTYVFDDIRSVPELSFSVREMGCTAGVMITASHNPPKYNGYKVYWDDGAQIVPPRDAEIIEEVNKTEFKDIVKISKEEAISKDLYTEIGENVDKSFVDKLKSLVLNPKIIKEQKDLKIVYTPLHGTGGKIVKRILSELGFENVYIVREQEIPDGDFPTVDFPNPEVPEAFDLAIKLAKEVDADIILANDPDADRIGLYSKDEKGDYIAYNGNMTAMLLAEYELSQRKEKGVLHNNGAFISTIVSTDMPKEMTKYYGIKLFETLTGFKWTGEKVRQFEKDNSYVLEFAFEESYGCIISSHARDKDGISAVMALCEAAAYYKAKGISLWQQMNNIYDKYGYYREAQISVVLEGIDGAKAIKEKMDKLRNSSISKIGKWEVKEIRDYENHIIKKNNGETAKTDLPTSNVLYFELSNDCWFCVRPSGTEPKIKYYIGVKANNMQEAEGELEKLKEQVQNL